jgi:hypothetical protein
MCQLRALSLTPRAHGVPAPPRTMAEVKIGVTELTDISTRKEATASRVYLSWTVVRKMLKPQR